MILVQNLISLIYPAPLLCAVLAMVLGMVWYGPMFGRKWAEIVGADMSDMEARKEMQKKAGPLYVVQFLLVLFQALILSFYLAMFDKSVSIEHSVWFWAAFVMPTVAGSAMWNNDTRKVAWARFLLQGGYQLVLFVMFGWVLSFWR